MGNKFDSEIDRLQSNTQDIGEPGAAASNRLDRLKTEIEASKAAGGTARCARDAGDLTISIGHQALATWSVKGDVLVLRRPGSEDLESTVTTVAEAAKMSARLIAAAAQA